MAKMDSNKVKKCLTGVSYPADKQELIQHAKNTCGDKQVVSMLKDLPEKTYGKSKTLVTELRGMVPGINVDIL